MFINRIIRALLLDINLYEEVEKDRSAIWQALFIVFLASLARGVYTYKLGDYKGLVVGTVTSFVLWVLLALLIYVIGTKLFPESETRTDRGELLRVLGFASAPGIFRVFAVIPYLTPVVFLLVWVWTLVAMIVAVRQALDFKNTWNAIWVCVVGLIAFWLVYIILLFAFDIPKPIWS